MNFQDSIENARRWAAIFEEEVRGSTISKATIDGAARLMRTLAHKLAWFVEYQETAEKSIAELTADLTSSRAMHTKTMETAMSLGGEVKDLKGERDAALSAQAVLLRERDVLRAELAEANRVAKVHADARTERAQQVHDLEQQVQRLHVALGRAVSSANNNAGIATNYSRQIDALRVELRDADAAANKATEKLTTLEAEYKLLRKMWGQQRATIEKYQQGERATRAEGGEPSETAGMHVPVTLPGVSFGYVIRECREPELFDVSYIKVGGTD